MNSVLPRLLTIGLVAGVAVLGSIAGRALWESVTAEDQPKAIAPSEETINNEAAQPVFEGEVLGHFLSPPSARVPDKFVTYEELCGSNPTEQVAWDRAGQFDLSIDVPEPFQLDTTSLNIGVVACGDTVYAARWEYSAVQPSGYPARFVLVRSVFKYGGFDVSPGRVQETEIGGLPAVYIKPLIASGIGSAAGVIFPDDPVTTSISATGVSETDLLRVAESAAEAVKKESRGD